MLNLHLNKSSSPNRNENQNTSGFFNFYLKFKKRLEVLYFSSFLFWNHVKIPLECNWETSKTLMLPEGGLLQSHVLIIPHIYSSFQPELDPQDVQILCAGIIILSPLADTWLSPWGLNTRPPSAPYFGAGGTPCFMETLQRISVGQKTSRWAGTR